MWGLVSSLNEDGLESLRTYKKGSLVEGITLSEKIISKRNRFGPKQKSTVSCSLQLCVSHCFLSIGNGSSSDFPVPFLWSTDKISTRIPYHQ